MSQTGPRGRLNTLASDNKEMRNIIEQLTRENRHLRQLEIRQTKALQKYERSEYSLPGILHHHQKQAEGLKDQIKKNQSLADRHERRSRHLEEELARKTAENDMLKRVAARGGGEGEKEMEGTKRRNEELKQKCETTEKEVATLKKHIDNLNRNHRREVASLQKKEKEAMTTMLSLQEKCKDSTRLLQLREKEANVNNIYSARGKDRDKKPPRSKSLDLDRKATNANSRESRNISLQSRETLLRKTRDGGEMMENPDYDDTNDSNGSVKDDGVNDDIDAESLILGVKGQIREAEVRLRGEHEVGEGDGYAGQGLADGNYAEESVVISGVDEVTSRDMNNQIKNSVAEDTTPSYKAAVGRKNIAATKAALKQDDGQPVMMPRPPSKPKEKTVVDKKEATEQDAYPPKPLSPAGLRLVDYESRMAKIRQKNQEKLVELRKKLDEKIGGCVGGGDGEEGGIRVLVKKAGEIRNDYDFKFPYDTLRRRRKGYGAGNARHVNREESEEERRAEVETDAEVAQIFEKGGMREDGASDDCSTESPSKHVVDMVMSWNSDNKQRRVPERIIDSIDIGSIGCEEDAGMNLQDSEKEWEKQNPAIIEEEREIRQNEKIRKAEFRKDDDDAIEDQREGRLSEEETQLRPEVEDRRKPEINPESSPTAGRMTAQTDESSPEFINERSEGASEDIDDESLSEVQAKSEIGTHSDRNLETGGPSFEQTFLTGNNELKSTSILKASTTEMRERNRERRRVNFFQSQWVIEEEEEEP